jgi:hypothetical protein
MTTESEIATPDTPETREMITRREAILRVSVLLGGVALVGGTALLTGCRDEEKNTDAPFTADEVGFLDEVADTILPTTSTPGAKAAKTGAFMALMVTDSYKPSDRKIFREGMRKLDEASRKANGVSFVTATPQQRIALLEVLDREQKADSDARKTAQWRSRRDRKNAQRLENQSAFDAGRTIAENSAKRRGRKGPGRRLRELRRSSQRDAGQCRACPKRRRRSASRSSRAIRALRKNRFGLPRGCF